MTREGGDTRPATKAEIDAFERGEQKRWRCPGCGYEAEVLSAVMVFCWACKTFRTKLVAMERCS